MEKKWYLKIESQEMGPYTWAQLRNHPLLTPDSLVRSVFDTLWKPARCIPELQSLFEDPIELVKEPEKKIGEEIGGGEIVLNDAQDPFHFIFWVLIIVFIMFYQFFHSLSQK